MFGLRDKEGSVVFHILLRTSVQRETCGKKNLSLSKLVSLLVSTNLSWKVLGEVPPALLSTQSGYD